MSVSVTNSNSTIIYNSGGSQIRISKRLVIVKDIGNDVYIEYGDGKYIQHPYTDFSAPSGASAAAVADAIEVFLDTDSTIAASITSLIPGTGATNLGKAVDDAAGATDTGVAMLVKRVNTPAEVTPANSDYLTLQTNANGALWTVRGAVTVKGAAKTRPADATAYAAGDVISESTSAGTGFTISNVVPISGGAGRIKRIVVRCSLININPALRIHIFDTVPANTVYNDNAPATTVYAASISEIATIDLPPMISGAANSGSVSQVQDKDISFLSSGTDLTVILETLNTFTPSSGNTWYIEITSEVY